MAYDPDKDILLWWKPVKGEGKTDIILSVYQYGSNDPKLGIARRFTKNGEPKFKKLGRLSKTEAENLLEVLPEAIQKL